MRQRHHLPLPPYSYVPGKHPHPISDPRGHGMTLPSEAASPTSGGEFWECAAYDRAVDLFNHGFYWESHECWEMIWHVVGRKGPEADFLKGLIKLAAALVKAREGRSEGVRRHAQRAHELLSRFAGRPGGFGGLDLQPLIEYASFLVENPQQLTGDAASQSRYDTPLLEPTKSLQGGT